MPFSLPQLKYKYQELEPYIDGQTMEIHYTKHHQAYIDNLNKALEGEKSLENMDIRTILENVEKVPEGKKQTVINNGGGHANHSFFWDILTPAHKAKYDKSHPGFIKALEAEFGSVENFKQAFMDRAMSVFGSGWCFLIIGGDKKLTLKRHSFQNSPLMGGNTPLLGIDLWEHAYYLKYQNRKKEYIDAFWNVINWEQVGKNFESASL